jgi:hypothetical protein
LQFKNNIEIRCKPKKVTIFVSFKRKIYESKEN